MKISLIAALSLNRVIGVNNQLPWHLPDDLQHFKSLTLGKTIIMGRKTYESIGKPLPKRRNIVLTKQDLPPIPGVEFQPSLEAALSTCRDEEEVMIIGGASLYQQALPLAQTLYLTQIETMIEGDAFFPEWDPSMWTLSSETYHPADEKHAFAFRFQTYLKNISRKILDINPLAEKPEYLPALSKLLYEEIAQHWVPGASVERGIERLKSHLNLDKLPLALVASIDQHPVGMACLRETDGIQPGVTPWLGSLVVDPNYRGNRIGETLIDAIKAKARLLGYDKIHLLAFDFTIPTWYAKLGWKLTGHDELFGHRVTVMSIEII